MKDYIIYKRTKWLLAAAFLCIVYLMWATFSNVRSANAEAAVIRNSLARLLHLENINVQVHAVETGERGFVVTGEESFLDSYYRGLRGLKADTVQLRNLPHPSTAYSRHTKKLFEQVHLKVSRCAGIIETRRSLGYDSAKTIILKMEGKHLTDSITRHIQLLKKEDRATLEAANAEGARIAGRTSFQLFLLALCFLAIIVLTYFIINNDFRQISAAGKQLKFNASIIRNISDPIITTDIFNKVTNWNTYAEELYGYTEAEVLGKDLELLLGPAVKSISSGDTKILATEKDFWKGELVHYHKNGSKLFTEVTTSAIREAESGHKNGFVSVIRNITLRKATEEKLQRLTSHLEEEVKLKAAELNNIFERITDAFIALDNEWRYTYINKKAAELHQRPDHYLIGKHMLEEFPDLAGGEFYEALLEAKNTNVAKRVQLLHPTSGKWYEDLIYPSPDGISVYYHDITETKLAELALLKTHEKLTYHINNTPMGVVEFDTNLNVVQWSERATEIFGWTKSELTGQRETILQTMVVEEELERVTKKLDQFLASNSNKGFIEIRNLTNDGRVITCEWYISTLKNELGTVVGLMSLVHDVTRRKYVQNELEDAESKFRSLVEQSMVGVYIIQSGKFNYANPRLQEILGYSFNDLENKLRLEDVVHPEDLEKVNNNISLRLDRQVKSINYELRLVKKNGDIMCAEVFGSLTQYMGEPAIIGTLIDVTEREESAKRIQESQAALAASNERFLLVARATNDAVWDWDIIRNAVWGNELFSRYFNLPLGSEVTFEDFIERVHPDSRQGLRANLNTAMEERQSTVNEYFLFRQNDGTYINIYDRAYIMYDEAGKPIRMLGAMQDITLLKRNEQQILFEKELSDSIINSLPGVFYLFNQAGVMRRWNTNFETITGYNADEIKKMGALDLVEPQEKERMAVTIKNVFETGEDFIESYLVGKDGKRTAYYFTGRVIQYEGEQCVMGVGIDISERVKSQQELAQSEDRYRTIIEQASDGIFISDTEGRYLDVNSNGELLSGYSKAELLNMTVYDLVPADDLMSNPRKFEELLSGGTLMNERGLRTKEGTIKDVEMSAKILGDGRFLAIVRDITTRKKNEDILKASEEKYRLLFNQNPMPMWMISYPEMNFLDVNDAAIDFYGYNKTEFLQMTAFDIMPKATAHAMKEHYKNHTGSGVMHAGIWEHLKKDGTVVKANIITHDISYEGRHAKLVLANDVTQKILAEEALKKSHEELRQLATHLEAVRERERTHIAREIHDELGQQLTGLKMDMSWINKRLQGHDEEIRQKIKETIELVDETVRSVRRIATELRPSILDDLGLLAAMEWQTEEFEKRSEICCTFSSNVSEATVSPDIATSIFRIYQECLTNVLRHAGATLVNSFLQITENILVLTISDNGKGFIESEIAAKKTLGLLGMKERALLLGGTYEITSRPAKGTSVLIIIPLKN